MQTLQEGQVANVFNGVVATTQISDIFALPSRVNQITWQTIFDSSPSSVTLKLETSLDGTNWSDLDSTTDTTGVTRTVVTSAIFVRGEVFAVSGGSLITLELVSKFGLIGDAGFSPTFASLDLTGNLNVQGSADIAGSVILSGHVDAAQDLHVFGNETVNGTIQASSYKSVSGSTGVTTTQTISGVTLTIENGLIIGVS